MPTDERSNHGGAHAHDHAHAFGCCGLLSGRGGGVGRSEHAQGGPGGRWRAEPAGAAGGAGGRGRGPASRRRQERHPALDGRRAEPDRHLGPQARPAARRTAGRSASSRRRLPGVSLCEHLPKQAAMLDKFTIIRSVDCRHSNHEPNKVFQTGNLEAEPRINPSAEHVPGDRLGRRQACTGRTTRRCRPTSRS